MARSDVQLMLDVKAGDDVSFELLLHKYRTPLVHFLCRMVKDQAAAEDLAQEVFLRVYRARKEYSPSAGKNCKTLDSCADSIRTSKICCGSSVICGSVPGHGNSCSVSARFSSLR